MIQNMEKPAHLHREEQFKTANLRRFPKVKRFLLEAILGSIVGVIGGAATGVYLAQGNKIQPSEVKSYYIVDGRKIEDESDTWKNLAADLFQAEKERKYMTRGAFIGLPVGLVAAPLLGELIYKKGKRK